MRLECIITLANEKVRLPFLAMERSLRATGCDLPLRVIPYNDAKFDLPDGSEWWEVPEFLAFIDREGNRPVMRKYQALLSGPFQFLDTDAVFLKDPTEVLAPLEGWVNSCCHWHNPFEATTDELRAILRKRSTTWPKSVFNSGQFACDRQLYTVDSLCETLTRPEVRPVALDDPFHEQPGMNLLAHLSGVPISNLTLPPHCMESTWAGDYPEDDFEQTWTDPDRKPYLIHWAGHKMDGRHAIDHLALDLLTEDERADWLVEAAQNPAPNATARLKRGLRAAHQALRDSWDDK